MTSFYLDSIEFSKTSQVFIKILLASNHCFQKLMRIFSDNSSKPLKIEVCNTILNIVC